MDLTVKTLLSRDEFKNISVEAGKNGVNKQITSIQIADYEFSEGYKYDKDNTFLKGGIVISSLLFAVNNKDALLDAIKDFVEAGSTALLYKTVLFEELPAEVLDFADKNDFPILKFNDLYFEDIIYNLMDILYRGDNHAFNSDTIESFIENRASKYAIEKTAKEAPLFFRQFAIGVYVVTDSDMSFNSLRINKSFQANSYLKPKAITCNYQNGLFILITAQNDEEKTYTYILDYILDQLFISREQLKYFMSKVHKPFEELDKCFKESYFTYLASLASNEYYKRYSDIGIFRFLIPLKDRHSMSAFSDDFINKINSYPELMDTLKAFVKNKGSILGTAYDTGCHENTIRYRIGKIMDLLEMNNSTNYELYENASLAIKIQELKKLDTD